MPTSPNLANSIISKTGKSWQTPISFIICGCSNFSITSLKHKILN